MIELTLQHNHNHQDHQHSNDQHTQDEESNISEVPCHPHRHVKVFDFTAIQEQILAIRRKKEAARLAAQLARKVAKQPHQIYEADVIEEALEQSRDMVPSYVGLALRQRIKFIEDKVFISAQNQNYGDFVSRIKQETLDNEALANELNLVMTQVQIDINNDINDGVYEIHSIQRKKRIFAVQPEPAHRVKLKNMLIRSKIMDLKQEFNKSELQPENVIRAESISSSRIERKQGQVWGDEFHLMSEGTKKAKQFVLKVKAEQKMIRKQKYKKRQQLQSLQVKSAMQHKQFEQQMKKEKHESLKKRYEQTRIDKMMEKEKQVQNQKQYIKFVKEYQGRKPLFKIKEEQYMQNVLQEELKRRKMKLVEIHQSKRPMNHDQLIEHQMSYQQLKKEKELQIKHEKEIKKKEEASLPRKSFYRGKFHSIIVEQKEKQEQKRKMDPFEMRAALLKKQKEFGELIRQKYAPHISQAKKKHLQELMKSLERGKNEKALSEQAYKHLGNEYLKQLHKMIKQLKQKGLIKTEKPNQQKAKVKNYLQDVRNKYNFSTIDFASQMESNSQWVQNKAIKLQKDARSKEKVLRYNDEFDIEKYMKQLDQINENYINAAEAKMTLIKKLKGENYKTPNNESSLKQSKISLQLTESKDED